MKSHLTRIILVIIFVSAIWFRTTYYGNFRLSIATNDTLSYINSSRAPLFSWKSFAGTRLFSTNLIYKLANDESKCKVLVTSYPAIGKERFRKIQPCFDRIVLFQNLLSIVSWCFLAWTTARSLQNPILIIILVIVILAFGFAPQIAEWDSVLSIESFSISFFILSATLLQEIVLLIRSQTDIMSQKKFFVLGIIWLAVYIFWVFLRDVHLYTVPFTIALIIGTWFIYARGQKTKQVIFLTILLVGIFILGYKSSADSLRATHDPLVHAFDRYIAPFPARLDFFKRLGMPDQGSPEFETWFDHNATKTYGMFLLTHPRFVLSTLLERQFYLRHNVSQPYYPVQDTNTRDKLIQIGELVHPESLSIYLVLFTLLLTLWIKVRKNQDPWLTGWTWLTSWVFFCAAITLFLTFFGDVDGTYRHVFPSIEYLHISAWLNLGMILDYAIGK